MPHAGEAQGVRQPGAAMANGGAPPENDDEYYEEGVNRYGAAAQEFGGGLDAGLPDMPAVSTLRGPTQGMVSSGAQPRV